MDIRTSLECFFSLSILTVLVLLAFYSSDVLFSSTIEDGPLANLSAIFFAVSSIFFILASKKLLTRNNRKWKFAAITIAWSVLMFVFSGEEISWGQRIFDFSTPEGLSKINLQNEFNIHNIEIVDTAFGGKYRYLSLMMLCFSVLFPVLKYFSVGRKVFKLTFFPVATHGIALLVLSAYIYGKVFHDVLPNNVASEIREFLFSLGVCWFSFLCAFSPERVYIDNSK